MRGLSKQFRAIAITINIGICIWFLLPVLWMVATSFRSVKEMFTIPPSFAFHPTLVHYIEFLGAAHIIQRYINTIIIAFGSSAMSLAIGALCGYALARLRIKGGTTLAALVLASRAIPPIATVIPLYLIFRDLGMLDQHVTLILAYSTFLIPYVIWLTRSFFLELPRGLEEAALIDGCSRLSAFFRVIVPCALPGLVATMIFCVILAWNEFLFALILTNRDAVTIPVAVAGMVADPMRGTLWGPLTAVGTLTILPVMAFALAVQKYLIRGLSFGSMSN